MNFNLSQLQTKIVNSTEDKVIVVAAAGSGKTTCLTAKFRKWLDEGVKPEEIICITFTNQAAEEMRDRIGIDAQGSFIGTVHAYANYLLLANGIDTSNYLKNEEFDNLFELIKQNPQAVPHIKYLMLDEAQDSDENQHDFIFKILDPDHFFVVGDLRQCIYQFNGSRPDLFMGLTVEKGAKAYNLNENYRNSREILSFAKWIINEKIKECSSMPYVDNSIGLVLNKGLKKTFEFNLKTIANMVSQDEHYNDWFILARSNKRVEEIYEYLKKYDIPVDTFKKSELSNKDLHDRMQANTIKVLTIHSSKGLEANKVIVVDAVMSREEECRISYVAATRARNELYWAKRVSKKKIQNW